MFTVFRCLITSTAGDLKRGIVITLCPCCTDVTAATASRASPGGRYNYGQNTPGASPASSGLYCHNHTLCVCETVWPGGKALGW